LTPIERVKLWSGDVAALRSQRMVSYDALLGALMSRVHIADEMSAVVNEALLLADASYRLLTEPTRSSPYADIYRGVTEDWFWYRLPLQGPVLEHMLEDLTWEAL